MKMRQCVLSHKNSRMVTWLDDRPGLKVGNQVTLKDSDEPGKFWLVESVSDISMDRQEIKGGQQSKKWHKNDLQRGQLRGI